MCPPGQASTAAQVWYPAQARAPRPLELPGHGASVPVPWVLESTGRSDVEGGVQGPPSRASEAALEHFFL
jgi:hypothetical protein